MVFTHAIMKTPGKLDRTNHKHLWRANQKFTVAPHWYKLLQCHVRTQCAPTGFKVHTIQETTLQVRKIPTTYSTRNTHEFQMKTSNKKTEDRVSVQTRLRRDDN